MVPNFFLCFIFLMYHTPESVRTEMPRCTHFGMKYQIFLDIHEQFGLIELEISYYAYFQIRNYSVW